MKKYVIGWLILDILFALGAFFNVCIGEGTTDDYVVLYFSISILVGFIISKICKEIKIQKRLKEIRQERNKASEDLSANE